MSDTPRTDAKAQFFGWNPEEGEEFVTASFARKLERENAELRADKERLDWLEASDLWPAYLDFWPNHLPQLGGSLRAAIDAARKEEQP
jgi:hypothetical protein